MQSEKKKDLQNKFTCGIIYQVLNNKNICKDRGCVQKIGLEEVHITLFFLSIQRYLIKQEPRLATNTLQRGNIMYEFLDRLITAALPRVREFQGVKNSGFDGRGNYTLGITEQIIFPEIDIDKINNISGMDITFVTSTNDDSLAKSLLKELGLPFKKS